MINLKQFLKSQPDSFYAFVTFRGEIEPTYFCRYDFDGKPWFLESPCELQFFGKKAVVENYQVPPYFPSIVDDIEVASEKDILKYLLKREGIGNK